MSSATVDAVWERVQARVWDVLPTLSPPEVTLLQETEIDVAVAPSPYDLKVTGVPPGSTLAGIFEHFAQPPDRISVFAIPVTRAGVDPGMVLLHELSHRYGYDHSKHPGVVALMAGSPQAADTVGDILCSGPGCAIQGPAETACTTCGGPKPSLQTYIPAPRPTGVGGLGSYDSCPVCVLHERVSHADGLLADLANYSGIQNQIPMGLGGTIPLARRRLLEAQGQLAAVRPMLPARAGQIRELEMSLVDAQDMLAGWVENPDQVNMAYQLAHRARRQAYLVAWAYYGGTR